MFLAAATALAAPDLLVLVGVGGFSLLGLARGSVFAFAFTGFFCAAKSRAKAASLAMASFWALARASFAAFPLAFPL